MIDFSAVDPNIVYLVLVLGLWASVTTVYVTGTGIAEILAVGGLLLGVAALTQMPTNWFALLLLVVGVAVFIVTPFIERKLARFAPAGLILQTVGGLFLFQSGPQVSPFVVAVTVLASFGYYQYVLLPILRNVLDKPVEDKDTLIIGKQGRVVKPLDPIGTVNVESELWTATTLGEHIATGEHIIVVDRKGLQLEVEPAKRKRESAFNPPLTNGNGSAVPDTTQDEEPI